MPEEAVKDLRHLPADVADTAATLPRAGDQLVRLSAEQLVDNPLGWRQWLVLRQVELRWRFYVAKTGKRVVFFFFRKQSPVEVVMDAHLEFRVAPSPLIPRQVPLVPREMLCQLVWPRLLAKRSVGTTDRVTFQLDQAGNETLDAIHPETGPDEAELRYLRGPTEIPTRGADGQWRVAPFIAFIEAVRAWIGTGLQQGREEILTVPLPNDPLVARRILYYGLVSFCAAANATSDLTTRPTMPPLFEELQSPYDITGFRAGVVLRLKADGTEIAALDDDHPVQLMMELEVQRTPAAGARAKVWLGPPDFLLTGPLHQAFFDEFLDGLPLFANSPVAMAAMLALRTFVLQNANRISIFRVKRDGRRDTNALVVTGMWEGERIAVVLKGVFEVDTATTPPQVQRRGNIRLLQTGPVEPQDAILDEDVVRHFFHLMAALKSWGGVLP